MQGVDGVKIKYQLSVNQNPDQYWVDTHSTLYQQLVDSQLGVN